MSFKDFQDEVRNNRPRMALAFLEPVMQELLDRVTELEAHCCKCEVAEPQVDVAEDVAANKAPAKKAPAKKKAAAPKAEAKNKVVDTPAE